MANRWLGFGDKFHEPVKALAPALVETHFLMFFAVLHRPVESAGRVSRFPVRENFEGRNCREKRLRRGFPAGVVGIGKDDPLRLYHFKKNALRGILRAVGRTHHGAKHAARAQIHFTEGSGHAVRPPPIFQLSRPRLEEALPGRIDDAGKDKFAAG